MDPAGTGLADTDVMTGTAEAPARSAGEGEGP
jgi:hypothetical protein